MPLPAYVNSGWAQVLPRPCRCSRDQTLHTLRLTRSPDKVAPVRYLGVALPHTADVPGGSRACTTSASFSRPRGYSLAKVDLYKVAEGSPASARILPTKIGFDATES